MTLIDHGQSADTTTKKHHTGLIAVLAILAVALLAAGAWLIVDRQQQPLSVEEQQAAIMEVVTAHFDAVNARDADALRATITDDFAWDQDGWTAYADTYVEATMGYGTQEAFTGDDAVFSGDLQVTFPSLLVGNGTYTFTLREVDGQLKIATIVQQRIGQRQLLSTEQQAAIMDVVTAHRDAVNGPMEVATHDAILATLTDDATFFLSSYGSVVQRVDYARQELNTDLTFTEDPVFFGDLQVAIPVRREFHGRWENGEPVAPEVGTYFFTLREVDGQLKIATIVFNEES